MKTFTIVISNPGSDETPTILFSNALNAEAAKYSAIFEYYHGDSDDMVHFYEAEDEGDILVQVVEVKTEPQNLKTYLTKP
jgi:hypothetical protein